MSREHIGKGELAVKLAHDINGGLGNHQKGTVLRNLSSAAFTTLKGAGHHVLKDGSSAASHLTVEANGTTDNK